MLVFNVLGTMQLDRFRVDDDLARGRHGEAELPPPVQDLLDAWGSVSERRLVECWHDAQQARDQVHQMFSLGYLSLEMRGLAERLYWATCARVRVVARRLPRLPFAVADAELRLDFVDLFQVKKFVANYRAVSAPLDEPLRARFGLRFELPELGAALDEGGADPETFYIADAMHPDLFQTMLSTIHQPVGHL